MISTGVNVALKQILMAVNEHLYVATMKMIQGDATFIQAVTSVCSPRRDYDTMREKSGCIPSATTISHKPPKRKCASSDPQKSYAKFVAQHLQVCGQG
jgi:hypothetical protein